MTGEPFLCGDVTKETEYFPLFEYVRSELCVPVIVNDQIWGLINLDGLTVNEFNETDLSAQIIFAELASFAITSRLELNEQERLQQHLVQSEKLASLGEIIAGIAHEINNPLTSILGHASLLTLKRGGAADDASIEAIMAESARTAALVKSLLAFSRKEIGNQQVVAVNDVVTQVCQMKKYQLKVNNIRLETDLEKVSYPIVACSQQLQQVLLNLINNAEQAMTEERRDGLIRISTRRLGEKIQILVADNGKGIPAEAQKFIFDPFFTTKPLGVGTGLGLSIAHTIIEKHGGNLEIAQTSSAGTTFKIELPLAHLGSVPVERNSITTLYGATLDPKPRRGRVLVVDDEPQILETLCDYLRLQNIDAESAKDGASALEKLKADEFNLIVSDIRMPGVDGLQLYDQAKLQNPRYATNFVFMSGDLVRPSTRSFVESSGCICLEKPFPLQDFLQKIDPYLDS